MNLWGDAGIDIYTVSTGDIRSLGDVRAAHLTWSPDGTTIAFTHGENEPDRGIWLVDADGTNLRPLVPSTRGSLHGIGVVWSPRGDLIAYQRTCAQHPAVRYEREHPGSDVTGLIPGAGCGEDSEVVLVSATSDDPANPIGTEHVIPPPQTDSPDGPDWWFPTSVTWTPDGTHLLYTGWRHQGTGGVIAVPIDGAQPPIVLGDGIGTNDYDGTPWIPIQTMGGTGPLA